ncbi:MAG: phage/plasmid primase, P4 family [Proteiniphilum sp.]|nr:phage/plasmid primase, P4 family [Proteiniphilum sp.]
MEGSGSAQYTPEQKADIINKIIEERSKIRVTEDVDESFKKYYQRFLAGEVQPEELQKYDGDWLRALKEKDYERSDDFLQSEGWAARCVNIAAMNNRPLTDFGNAERLVDQANYYIRYCHQFTSWFIYTNSEGRWKKDETGFINRIGKDTIRRIHVEASRAPTTDSMKAFSSWAYKSEARAALNNMVKLAEDSKRVIVTPDNLDNDDYLFNLRNGTLDLKTFELKEHNRMNFITRIADYEYDGRSQCPLFNQYLNRIFRSREDKDEMIAFLRRAVGYTLTGSTQEQSLFLLYGSGANGKSVFLDILNALMGEYGTVTQSKTFTTERGEISNDIAALAGKRMVYASENSSDTKLDESMIKQLTGGENISARFLHQEFFTFKPRFKIWWAFNHPPAITDMTNSIWRRIKIIPFNEVLPENEWDKKLAEKIITRELSGVFNWAICGLKDYYALGSLNPPKIVADATQRYKEDQDILHDFITEFCEEPTANDPFGKQFMIKASELYEAYKSWNTYNGDEKPMSSTKFGRLLHDKGIQRDRKADGKYYIGLKLKSGKLRSKI